MYICIIIYIYIHIHRYVYIYIYVCIYIHKWDIPSSLWLTKTHHLQIMFRILPGLHRASCPSRPTAEHRADPDGQHWTWKTSAAGSFDFSDEWMSGFMDGIIMLNPKL